MADTNKQFTPEEEKKIQDAVKAAGRQSSSG